jgi:biofilm PGA synthesis N-glycosyltransferase PgaC
MLVPAFNEASSIADTIISLQNQSRPPESIIVIDDFSTDATGEIALALGATVVRPPRNTGSKAGAQNFALPLVRTEFCMAIDADTVLAPDSVEKIMASIETSDAAAACGFVLPRHVRTIWERGRYIEYLFAFTFYKQVQDHYCRPTISSGCFSVYRMTVLNEIGGWSTRTMAEDVDLTWTLYDRGYGVRFVPEAVSYPIEPESLHFMGKQLRRWSHGFLQNVRVHWRAVLRQPYLRTSVAVGLFDALVASFGYLLVVPALAILLHPAFLLIYVIDLPAIAVPVLAKAAQRGETLRALVSLPCFIVLRCLNAVYLMRAAWAEFVLGRPLLVYEKGH